MDDVSGLDLDVVGVHPVHELFVGVELGKDFVLFAAVVSLDLLLSDVLFCYEFCFVGQTCEHHFVATQVHNRVREDIKDFSEDLSDESVGLFESDV